MPRREPATVALLVALSSACAPAPPREVTAVLTEYAVAVPRELGAGTVTIHVENRGLIAHDLTILRTDAAEASLETRAGQVVEDGLVAKTETLRAGATALLRVDLGPGRYVLLCDQVGHYALGQHAAVTVR